MPGTESITVAVLGLGRMGAYVAADFALGGHSVRCTASARTSARQALSRVREAAGGDADWPGDVTHAGSAAEAASGAQLILECLPERLELKHRALREAQTESPEAILGTNTSSLTIGSIADGVPDPSSLLGVHYVNPPWAYRLVEVIAGPRTAPSVVTEVERILATLDRVPVRVNSDIPGFVFNRLQFAVLREATELIEAGVISAADLDRLMVEGLGRRWSITGPIETAALGGTDLFVGIAERLYPELSRATTPVTRLDEVLATTRPWAVARDERNRRLLAGDHLPKPWRNRLNATPVQESPNLR